MRLSNRSIENQLPRGAATRKVIDVRFPLDQSERVPWLIRGLLAGVWLVMGLLCKLLGWVPRHEEIVARILGNEHAHLLTQAIGLAEIGIAAWILSGILPRWCGALGLSVAGLFPRRVGLKVFLREKELH